MQIDSNMLALKVTMAALIWAAFLCVGLEGLRLADTNKAVKEAMDKILRNVHHEEVEAQAFAKNVEDSDDDDDDVCKRDDYFATTAQEMFTSTIGGLLLSGTPSYPEYEASGIAYRSLSEEYWVVSDNLWDIVRLNSDLLRAEENGFLSLDVPRGADSEFEGIAFDLEKADTFYLLSEAEKFGEIWYPVIRKATMTDESTYHIVSECIVDYALESDSKGLEGLDLIKIGGQDRFIGLCEGNHCKSGKHGKKKGHGRVLGIEYDSVAVDDPALEYNCKYNVLGEPIPLPATMEFTDYSDIRHRQHEDQPGIFDVVVVSQKNSEFWVGTVQWTGDTALAANFQEKYVQRFPRDSGCHVQFCNVEGVAFRAGDDHEDEFVMVSDRVKKDGDQSFRCGAKDQSVHMFKRRLP